VADGLARPRLNAVVVLSIAAFVSIVDRSVTPPLVPVIADDFATPVAQIGIALTLYSIAYAVFTLPWSILSTHWGRVRVLAVSTGIAALANAGTALSQDQLSFTVSRGISGAAFAATFTVVLVYFGDSMTMARRAVATANLAAAVALGLALGTLGAGAIAHWLNWRWVFAVVAIVSVLLVVLVLLLPEPPHGAREGLVPSLARLVRTPWAIAVLGITLLEGVLLIGIYNYFPVALQETGTSVLVAGAVTAAFGASVIVVSQLMKLVLGRWPAWLLLLIAGVCVVGGYIALGLTVTPASVVVASVLLGIAWALGHTTIQTWMTDAAATARPIGMALFSIALFTGASIGAALGGAAADTGVFGTLFTAAAVASVVFTILATAGRARYRVGGS